MGDLAAGAALLAVVAAVVIYAFSGSVPFRHSYALAALVRDSAQLRIGSPVRVAGVDEGSVTAIGAGPHGTTRVRFTLSDGARPIHADATLRIRPRTFLEGGFYIDLQPGTPAAPELGSGATMPVWRTSGPVQLSQVLSTFTLPYRQGLQRIFAEMSTALTLGAGSVRTLAPQLTPLLRDTAWLTQAARGTEAHDLSLLITSSARVTGALAAGEGQLVDLVHSLRVTSQALSVREGALGSAVRQLDGLVRDTPPALAALDGVIPALDRFSVAFETPLRQAPPLVSALTSAVNRFGSLVRLPERTRVVTSLRAALSDLPTLLLKLADTFPPLGPTANCLTKRILPIFTAEVPDGSLSTGRPVWQDLLHGLVGLAGSSQNFDGNGFWVRYEGGGGTQTVTIPGFGGLIGSTPGSSPLQGSRPVWLGVGSLPPIRPQADCAAQPLVKLASPTGPADDAATARGGGR